MNQTTMVRNPLTLYIIEAMINPLDLNTDNMTRVDGFNLFIPRKVQFRVKDQEGLKSKLVFNDYLMYYESEEESARRLQDALGLTPKQPFASSELVPEGSKKLMTNVSKSELITQPTKREVIVEKAAEVKGDSQK